MRSAQASDVAALCRLWSAVYAKPLSAERWRWKLGYPTTGVLPNVWLAERNGMPVCQYAGIPVVLRLAGQDRSAMVAVDAMTSPEHRRSGLLTEVVTEAHRAWRASGIRCVLGLPNRQWGSRTRALGWKRLFELRWLTRPLDVAGILRRRLGAAAALAEPLARAWLLRRVEGPRLDPGLLARQVDSAGPRLDVLWESVEARSACSVRRDAAWVAWRFLATPPPGYRLLLLERGAQTLGWSALRSDAATGLIADLVADGMEPAAWDELIEASVRTLAAAGAAVVSTLAVPGTERYGRFVARGFVPRRRSFAVHAAWLDSSLSVARFGEAASWDMAGGDFDVI